MAMLRSKLVLGIIFHTLAIIALIAPNVVWFYINRATYFETGVDKLSVGAMLTVFYMLLMVKGAFKDIDKRFATFMNLFLVLAITWFFESVINDLFWIVLCGIIGYAFYLVFSTIAKRYMNYHNAVTDERARVYARNEVGNV